MKLEFSLTSKVNPAADCRISLDCSVEELSVIINDPIYQELGHKLAQEVSFKPQANDRPNADRSSGRPDRNQSQTEELRKLREVVEAERRTQGQKIETLQSLMMSLRRKIDDLNRN